MDLSRNQGNSEPGNELETHLVQLWQKLLNLQIVGLHDNFFELGGDSLTGAICIYRLQEEFKREIPLAAIFEAPTITELARYIERFRPVEADGDPSTIRTIPGTNIKEQRPMILVPIQPEGSQPPLFCIHPAGGIVFPYYPLALYLGKDQPVFGIQDPNLYSSGSGFTSIEVMATYYLDAIRKVQPGGPYRLLGWSVGGLVAYEIAQQSMRQGESIDRLILLDSYPPIEIKKINSRRSLESRLHSPMTWIRSLPSRIRKSGSMVHPVTNYVRSGLFLLRSSMKSNHPGGNGKPALGDILGWADLDTWRNRLLNDADIKSVVSQQSSLLLVQMPDVRRILNLVKAHMRIAHRYRVEPYPGQIELFRAIDGNGGVPQEQMASGWEHLAGGVTVHPIHSNHVALLARPYVETLGKELRACLDDQSSKIQGDSDEKGSRSNA
jgi:thioesterase domain-containing protein/acyl carrier protein